MTASLARRAAASLLLMVAGLAPAAFAEGVASASATDPWAASVAPLPGNATASDLSASVASVACGKAACVAGGHYNNATGHEEGVVLTRSNGKWAPTAALPTGSTESNVTAVACDASTCAAVGSYYKTGVGERALLMIDSGGSWTTPALSGLTTATARLKLVACSTTVGCVGFGQETSGQNFVVDEVDTSWTVTSLPDPSNVRAQGGAAVTLAAATCGAMCVAVGSWNLGGDPGNYSQAAVVVQGSGTKWSDRAPELPANALPYTDEGRAGLTGISCVGSSCVAVGYYNHTTSAVGSYEGLLETRLSGKWSGTEAPHPTGATTAANLFAIACIKASCAAVGRFTGSTGGGNLLVTGSPGSSWTAAAPAVPAGGSWSAGLTSVSCGSSALCAASGTYYVTNGPTDGELLLGPATGSGWTSEQDSATKGTADPRIASMACTALCVAAGTSTEKKTGSPQGLFETHRA